MSQPGQLSVVGHNAITNQRVEPNSQAVGMLSTVARNRSAVATDERKATSDELEAITRAFESLWGSTVSDG